MKTPTLTPNQLNLNGRPVDLTNQQDIDLIIKRNARLNRAIESGLPVYELNVKAYLELSFECLKCGYTIENRVNTDEEDPHFVVYDENAWTGFKCKTCNASYRYDEESGNIFFVRAKESVKKQLTKQKQ